jgi:hypothetical protein
MVLKAETASGIVAGVMDGEASEEGPMPAALIAAIVRV